MAKVIYTVVPRVINGEYIRADRENPVKVTFPKDFDPFGRIIKVKGKRTEVVEVEKEIEVVSPKGERFKTKVKMGLPHEVETEIEKYVEFTEAEHAANGLIVREEAAPVPAEKLTPHHAGAQATGTPASSRDKLPEAARPSDREPSK